MQQKHLQQKRTQAELLPVNGLAGVLLRLGVQAQVSQDTLLVRAHAHLETLTAAPCWCPAGGRAGGLPGTVGQWPETGPAGSSSDRLSQRRTKAVRDRTESFYLLPANRNQGIVPSCSTGWMTCLCFMSFKSLSRIFWKEAIISARLSALGLDGFKSELCSSLMSNRSPPSGESAVL